MVSGQELRSLGSFGTGLAFIALIVFAVLKWVGVPAGSLLDWIIGLASFWWLLVIVTVPWNVHFTAKQALASAHQSRDRNLPVNPERLAYVQKIAKRSLVVAIALHLISAIVLYLLAATGISSIGYFSSIAALLLTGLRPAVVFYSYLANQLKSIEKEFKYPRDDVLKLMGEVAEMKGVIEDLKHRATALERELDGDRDTSFAAQQYRRVTALTTDLQDLSADHRQLAAQNQADHAHLQAEARDAMEPGGESARAADGRLEQAADHEALAIPQLRRRAERPGLERRRVLGGAGSPDELLREVEIGLGDAGRDVEGDRVVVADQRPDGHVHAEVREDRRREEGAGGR